LRIGYALYLSAVRS